MTRLSQGLAAHPVAADLGMALIVGASFANYFPPIAAALGALWYSIEIWESGPGKRMRGRFRGLWKSRGRKK